MAAPHLQMIDQALSCSPTKGAWTTWGRSMNCWIASVLSAGSLDRWNQDELRANTSTQSFADMTASLPESELLLNHIHLPKLRDDLPRSKSLTSHNSLRFQRPKGLL